MGHGTHDDEPLDEGPDDEQTPRGAPPDPLDRLWVHPTELPALAPGLTSGERESTRRSPRWWLSPVFAGAAGAVVTLAILAIAGMIDDGSPSGSPSIPEVATARTFTAQDAASRVGVSLIAVTVRDATGTRRGSGVCVRHGGQVLTSARLLGSATKATVQTTSGQRFTARVLARDKTTDLALLAVDSGYDLPAADLATRAALSGTQVWIVGAPTPGTTALWMSSGMLSSTSSIAWTQNGPDTGGLLETDAIANDAAQGGALIDRSGSVVGIVLGRVGTSNTTYAVPIGTAVVVADQLRANGKAAHGSAGLVGTDSDFGPTVVKVDAGGPAARAGMRQGDVVLSVDGLAVESMSDLLAIVRSHQPGDKLRFAVERRQRDLDVQIVLAEAA
ncbi:MAG TPA: trypsin-like peptidase domain-containing protein [Acidimicrobiia bacterium]|jgi:S1-C subfamily serine protease|nr:trypsin-like peptidase domain-containing protein [Acidimicrobiia bacterium]